MATATYVPLATQTLASAASSIIFSSIPSGYTDLKLVASGLTTSSPQYTRFQVNNDTGANYSSTFLETNEVGVASYYYTNQNWITFGDAITAPTTTVPATYTMDIFSYTNPSIYKTMLQTSSEDKNGTGGVTTAVVVYRSTSAINAIKIYPASGNFNAGTTATLWGI